MIGMLGRLFRWRLALLNGLSAAGGALLFPAAPDPRLLGLLGAGVTLLAAAASALNQVLERDLDARMLRTCDRPLPTGRIAPGAASATGVALALAGAGLLALAGGAVPALLGAAALGWYLGLYTPLKRKSSLALALGAICGALPPVIGWSGAGGSLADFRVLLLAGLWYLWQMPHFWVLQRRHADDYRRAGLPLFDPAPVSRLWGLALVVATLMLPALGVIAPFWGACAAASCLPVVFMTFRRPQPLLFACLNLFPLLITVSFYAGNGK